MNSTEQQQRLINLTQAEYEAMAWAVDLAAHGPHLIYLATADAENVKQLAERFKY